MALLVVILAGCGGGPNLDKAVAGDSASSIRDHIVSHQDWGKRLSSGELDQVAAFIARYAGKTGSVDQDDPGLVIWNANGCAACHVLAAGPPTMGPVPSH